MLTFERLWAAQCVLADMRREGDMHVGYCRDQGVALIRMRAWPRDKKGGIDEAREVIAWRGEQLTCRSELIVHTERLLKMFGVWLADIDFPAASDSDEPAPGPFGSAPVPSQRFMLALDTDTDNDTR